VTTASLTISPRERAKMIAAPFSLTP
jgi:hypothetical protein